MSLSEIKPRISSDYKYIACQNETKHMKHIEYTFTLSYTFSIKKGVNNSAYLFDSLTKCFTSTKLNITIFFVCFGLL